MHIRLAVAAALTAALTGCAAGTVSGPAAAPVTTTATATATAEVSGADAHAKAIPAGRPTTAQDTLLGGIFPTKALLTEAAVRAIPAGSAVYVAGVQDGLRKGVWVGLDGDVILIDVDQPLRTSTEGSAIWQLDAKGNGEVIGIVDRVTRNGLRVEGLVMERELAQLGSELLLTPEELWFR